MDFSSLQFPMVKNVSAKLLADDIIGVRPGDTPKQSMDRHLMEQRKKKIEKIKNRMNEKIRINGNK